jgi:hypothetical protein
MGASPGPRDEARVGGKILVDADINKGRRAGRADQSKKLVGRDGTV